MSGIYINGMEMPKNCCDCPFGSDVDIGVGVVRGCNLLKDFAQFADERHADCPLVSVPPHGRLGDLDELARKIEHDRYNHTHTDGLAARHHIAEYGHFLNAIAVAPTIIPADPEEGEMK